MKHTQLKTETHKYTSKVLKIPFENFKRFNTFTGKVNHNRPLKPSVKPKLPKLIPPKKLEERKSNTFKF